MWEWLVTRVGLHMLNRGRQKLFAPSTGPEKFPGTYLLMLFNIHFILTFFIHLKNQTAAVCTYQVAVSQWCFSHFFAQQAFRFLHEVWCLGMQNWTRSLLLPSEGWALASRGSRVRVQRRIWNHQRGTRSHSLYGTYTPQLTMPSNLKNLPVSPFTRIFETHQIDDFMDLAL